LNTNTCSIDAAEAQLCLLAGAGNLKLTNTFSIDTAQAQPCTHVRGLTLQPGLGLASQKFPSEGFLLENLQSNSFSLLNWTRKPDQVSVEVLAFVQFSQINTLLII